MGILVGELAQLYGLSNQTLHYYEDKGILRPVRDVVNGYRSYESADLQRLGTIKKYRNIGFSLPEGVRLCEADDPETLTQAYIKRRDALKNEIIRQQRTLAHIDEELLLYERFKTQKEELILETLPTLYRFDCGSSQEIFTQDERIRKEAGAWFSHIFYTAASERYYARADGTFSHYTRGMIADEATVQAFLIPTDTPNVQVIPGGRFATYMVCADSPSRIQHTFDHCCALQREHGFILRGEPFSRAVLVCRGTKQHSLVVRQVLLPIE